MIAKIRDILRHNLPQKILSVVAAIVLWLFVMNEENPIIDGSYSVPLTVANVPRNCRPFYNEQNIKIVLRAPRSMFAAYTGSDFKAVIDLKDFAAGEYDVEVAVSYPKGFEFVSSAPDHVHVKLDSFIERDFRAEAIVTGKPAEGAAVREVRKSAETVTAIGPSTLIDSVARVIGYVALSGNDASFEMQVPLAAVNDNGREVRGVRVVPSALTVNVAIESGIQKKIVPVVADLAPPDGFEIEDVKIDSPQVSISGRDEILNSIVTIKTEPKVISPGSSTFSGRLRLAVPEGVNVDVGEVGVSAKIRKRAEEPEETKVFEVEENKQVENAN